MLVKRRPGPRRQGPWAALLVAWHADPAGKVAQPRQGAAGIEPEQVFGHPVDGRAVPDLGGRGALGGEQSPVASLRLSRKTRPMPREWAVLAR